MIENLVLGRSGLNSSVCKELFISYLCISFMKFVGLSSFCINFFFQNCNCSRFSIDRSSIFTDQNSKVLFLKKVSPHVFFTVSRTFEKLFSLSLFDRSNLRVFVIFFHKSLQGFCPQALVSLLYPSFFNKITCFMHFHAFYFKNSNIVF